MAFQIQRQRSGWLEVLTVVIAMPAAWAFALSFTGSSYEVLTWAVRVLFVLGFIMVFLALARIHDLETFLNDWSPIEGGFRRHLAPKEITEAEARERLKL